MVILRDPHAGTTTLDNQYRQLTTVHGRDYQKFSLDHSIHFVPVDEEEAERLEAQHRVLNIVFDGRLFFPPVGHIRSVLDCGYGAASWAAEVADKDPECTVIGVDISLHMKPDDLPDNFIPQLDDINRPFTFDANSFDFVHSRMVGGGINKSRWQTYLLDIKKWSNNYSRSIDGVKDPRAPLQLQALLSGAGFTEIETNMIPLPLCAWGDNARQRRIGQANRENIDRLLAAFAIFPFTRRLGMSINAVNELVNRARVDATNANLKPYFPLEHHSDKDLDRITRSEEAHIHGTMKPSRYQSPPHAIIEKQKKAVSDEQVENE
ncbi:MAG: hypothetical protein Q9186_005850 [Xanthomendoza sp. 1 TL-2023]